MRTSSWLAPGALVLFAAACSGTSSAPDPGGGSTTSSGSGGSSGSTGSTGSSGSSGSTSSGGSSGNTGSTGSSGSAGGVGSNGSSGSTGSSGSGGGSSGSSDAGSSGGDDASSSSSGSGGGGEDAGDDGAGTFGPYPGGPYGTQVGSVIANMTWMGYRDDAADALATSKPYATYSLDDGRRSGRHYAMVNLAESDCPGCQKSAGEIASGGKSVVDAGGIVIEVLETTGFVTQASKTDLDAWVNKYMLPVTTVKDPDGTGTPTLNALGQREQAYIIDLTTMTIVQIIQGDITGIGATSGGKGLTAMHMLLGK